MEQLNKVEKLNENSFQNEEEVQVDDGDEENNDHEISHMDQLPNEILMKILDYFDEKQLVKCRLLSSRWNEISCSLLQDKSKNNPRSKLAVKLEEDMKCRTVHFRKPLDDFLNCFAPTEAEKSSRRRRPFPFACLSFANLKDMNWTCMCEFVSTFGPCMKTIIVDITQEDIANFQSFWKLLLHFAPNVQHLKIIGGSCLKNVRLFDPVAEFIAKFDPNFKVVNPNDTFLKNLKKLEIELPYFGEFNDFMKDLLDNAPNLKEVSCSFLWMLNRNELKNLGVWQELNKAHLLKTLEIKPYSTSMLSPAQLMKDLRLVTLRADFKGSFDFVENETSFTNYIYHALKSSPETLSNLHLSDVSMKFMALSFKDISSLPNIRQLQIDFQNAIESRNLLQRFSQVCPNTTNLEVELLEDGFSQVAPILWTRFQGLKSLKLRISLTDENDDNSFDLDSAISGYSKMSLWRIKARLKRGISLEEARRNEPQNPSILDLKGLSRLKLMFYTLGELAEFKNTENQLRNSIFIKILPQHIRENPRSICYSFTTTEHYIGMTLQTVEFLFL